MFFLPTISDEFEHVDVPVVEGMREIKFGDGSVQDFGRWGRRLITMEKTATDDGPPPTFGDHSDLIGEDRVPAHHNFAKRVSEGGMRVRLAGARDVTQSHVRAMQLS